MVWLMRGFDAIPPRGEPPDNSKGIAAYSPRLPSFGYLGVSENENNRNAVVACLFVNETAQQGFEGLQIQKLAGGYYSNGLVMPLIEVAPGGIYRDDIGEL